MAAKPIVFGFGWPIRAAAQHRGRRGFRPYENLHAPNERIKLNTIQMTSDVYSTAIHSLLAAEATPPDA